MAAFALGFRASDLWQRALPTALLGLALVGVPVLIFAPEGLPRMNTLSSELSTIQAENDDTRRQIGALRDEVTRLRDEPRSGSDTMTPEQMGETRTHEAEAACAILGARPVFFGQRTGDAQVNREIGDRFAELVKQIAPDVMFAHWPLDTNPDHQVAALLATRAYLKLRTPLPLYFYEVETGSETMGFLPTVFVDISATQAKKLSALQAHASQNPDRLYDNYHHLMERFRAREIAVNAAEAFVPFEPSLRDAPGGTRRRRSRSRT